MHGQYIRRMDRQLISEEDTFLWLSKGDLKAKTESERVADYIISACLILAKEQYLKRHDRVCAQLHFNTCKETGVQLAKNTGTNMYQNQ